MIEYDATRQAFAGIIEKPALTDQLLSRPPFKFLLDVITNTIISTGYLKSQFPKSDLDQSALADKGAKTAFLDKLIGAVDDGSLSAVKSAKIVAGKEPELTNKLLLKFAENARNFMGGGQAEKKSEEKPKEKSTKDKDKEKKDKDRSKSKDREKDKEKSGKSSSKEKEKRSSSKSRDKDKSKDKDEKKEKKSKKSSDDKEKSHKNKKEKENSPETSTSHLVDVNENVLDRDLDEGFEEVHQLSPHQLPEKMSPGNDSGILELDEQQPLVQRSAVAEFQRPSTAAARPQTSMGRPGTAAARPAPPKIKKKVIATIEEAPAAAESTMQIMAEEATADDDKNDLFVEEVIEEENSFIPDNAAAPIEAEKGGLVQKMMETKAGLEEGQLLDDIDEDDTVFQREMNKMNELQKTLQGITRTIYPLAHIFEFAQEDLEAMIRELEKWRAEVRQNEAELKEKESMSMGEAQKLTGTLSNLDEEIRNIKVTLSNCRARIVSNEERIQLLMKDV